jgi:hypothetical protein
MKYSWDKISLENYAAIDALNRGKVSDETMKSVSLLSLASGKPESHFESMDFVTLFKEMSDLTAFLEKPIEEKLTPVFYCGSRRFKLTCLTEEDIRGKHVEAISLLKVTPENIAENAPKIMAAVTEEVFTFRKKLSFDQKTKLFAEKLPASIGMGVVLFFWELSNELLPAILSYSQKEVQSLLKKQK